MPDRSDKPGLLEELQRRRVFRVAMLYGVVAWLLVQIGEATFDPLGLPDGSQRLLIILAMLGFPVALVFAWIFDLTPPGIVRTSNEPDAGETRRYGLWHVGLVTVGTFLFAVGVMLWRAGPREEPHDLSRPIDAGSSKVSGTERFRNPPLPDKPSIVVLPFDNISADPAQAYFVDGLTEELTGKLAGVSSVFVIARNSAFTYKGRAVNVKQVGQDLGVRYVLEGSVRKSGERIRVNTQLIDAASGFQIWSKRHDRDAADLLDLQTDIALEIFGALRIEIEEAELERIRRKPTSSLSAYDLSTRARAHLTDASDDGIVEARRLLQEAIAIDPDHASALASLGSSFLVEFAYSDPEPKLLESAESWLQKALAADPNEPEAVAAMAWLNLLRGQILKARAGLEKAIRLTPNHERPRAMLGTALLQIGDWEGARRELEYALRLNPNGHVTFYSLLAESYFHLGQIDEAVGLWEEVRAKSPAHLWSRIALIDHYAAAGRLGEAREIAQEISSLKPDFDERMVHRPGRMTLGDIPDPQLFENLRAAGLLLGTNGQH